MQVCCRSSIPRTTSRLNDDAESPSTEFAKKLFTGDFQGPPRLSLTGTIRMEESSPSSAVVPPARLWRDRPWPSPQAKRVRWREVRPHPSPMASQARHQNAGSSPSSRPSPPGEGGFFAAQVLQLARDSPVSEKPSQAPSGIIQLPLHRRLELNRSGGEREVTGAQPAPKLSTRQTVIGGYHERHEQSAFGDYRVGQHRAASP